jgi:glycosyltransferase involved in cell wall biosynthesis
MTQNPRVAVVMSAFNAERFLAPAVESILNQTWRDLSLIVVDDGSTDGTADILRGICDSRLQVLRQKRNLGLVQALNLAIGYTRSELVARMDADDLAMPERLAQQVALLDSQPQTAAVGTACTVIDDQDAVIGRIDVETDPDRISQKLLTTNQIVHPSVMMRASAVRELGGYRDLAGRTAQDYDLWLRMSERWPLANLAAPLLRYRVHSGQISVSKLRTQAAAAALYCALARQRRSSGMENLPAAWREVRDQRPQIRNACVAQLLQQADQLSRSGNEAGAVALHRQAALTGPFTPAFRQRARRWVIGKVHRLVARQP